MKLKEKEFEEIIQDLRSVASQLGATVRFEKALLFYFFLPGPVVGWCCVAGVGIVKVSAG